MRQYQVTVKGESKIVEATDPADARRQATGGSMIQPKQFDITEVNDKDAKKLVKDGDAVDLREVVQEEAKEEPKAEGGTGRGKSKSSSKSGS